MQEPTGDSASEETQCSLQSCLTLDEFVGEMLKLVEIIKQLSLDVFNAFCDKGFIADGNGILQVLPRLFLPGSVYHTHTQSAQLSR